MSEPNISPWQLPQPWEVSYIRPELMAFKRGDQIPLNITHDLSTDEAVNRLLNGGYLSPPRIVFIAHGFHNNINTGWLHKLKDEMLLEMDQTVVLVGWGRGADLLPIRYRQSAANTISVGTWLSDYVTLINARIHNIEIWGIGHSLGAHLIGKAGRLSNAFSRITGIDPAGPAFEKINIDKRLSKTDAAFVDIIHTDGYDSWLDPVDWISPVNHYGTLIPLGTVDFYANYGYHQPGAGDFSIAGSHLRAIDLFIWSVANKGKFVTSAILDGIPEFEKPVKKVKPALVTAEMGYYADSSRPTGCYFVETNSSEPWK